MELKLVLAWIVSGGGAGILAYLIIDWIRGLKSLAPKPKRIVAFALSAVIAAGTWTAGAFVGYQEMPLTALAWVEKLFLVGTSAFGLSQLIHIRDLPAVRRVTKRVKKR